PRRPRSARGAARPVGARGWRLGASRADLDVAVDLSNLVDLQGPDRRTVDHGSGGDVEAGPVALAHERRPGEQAAGERAYLLGAGAEVIERVEPVADTGDRDPKLAIAEVVRNDRAVRDRLAGLERAEVAGCDVGHRWLLVSTGSRG